MKRLLLKELEEWNKKEFRKPLIIYGSRQVGKTYLMKNLFAETYYPNKYIYIDFKIDEDLKDFLCGTKDTKGTVDAKKIINYLSYREGIDINKSTLLIFDEIQECLPIITSLKYFKQMCPEIPVICSGSMVRIKIKREQTIKNKTNKEPFFFPVGCIETLYLYPFNFEEYLINVNPKVKELIDNSYKKLEPLEKSYEKIALEYLYQFLLVGGMPEIINKFLNNAPVSEIIKSIDTLYNDYLNDMQLYQINNDTIIKCKKIFSTIYSQLSKEGCDYSPSLINKKYKNRDIVSPIDWLITSGVVYKSTKIKENITIPLMSENDYKYRLYLADIGLLAYQSQIKMNVFISGDSNNTLNGAFFENYIAAELKSYNIPLFYWKGKNDCEFEFIISDSETAYPIDVKKGKGTLNSLEKYKNYNKLKYAVKFAKNNFGYNKDNKILTIPIYAAFAFIKDFKAKYKI